MVYHFQNPYNGYPMFLHLNRNGKLEVEAEADNPSGDFTWQADAEQDAETMTKAIHHLKSDLDAAARFLHKAFDVKDMF